MAKQAITSLGNMLLIHFPVSVLENYPNADLSPLRRFVSHLFALFGGGNFSECRRLPQMEPLRSPLSGLPPARHYP
jgi:hypothetical protein